MRYTKMFKMKQNVFEAIQYYQNNKLESKTSICKQFHTDKSNFMAQCEKILPDDAFLKNGYYYAFNDEEKQLLKEYQNGASIPALMEKYNHTRPTIEKWIEVSPIDKRRDNRKYTLNEERFQSIETEEDAYWLGFLLADGYLNEDRGFLNLKLGLKDEDHLIKFKNYLNSTALIKSDKGGSGQEIKSLVINSRTLCMNLKQQGVFQGKTLQEKPNLNIPKHLLKHYIRGIIDGDGCLTHGVDKNQFGIVGTLEIVDFIRQYINDNIQNLEYKYIYEHGKIKSLIIRDQTIIKKCYEHFYKDAHVYLDRKYQIAMNYLNGRD